MVKQSARGGLTYFAAQLEARAEPAEARARSLERDDPASQSKPEAALPVSISGSARLGWYDGGEYASVNDAGARIWDARIFLDAELAEDVRAGAQPVARNIGFTFEWNLVRRGYLSNDVGELYVDFQGLGGSSWLNLRPGRFQIPVGEAYKRYSRGEASNPFITQPLGGPWYWDEGVMLYGSSEQGDLGYVASIGNGSTDFNLDADSDAEYTAKVWVQPTRWLYASASGLYQGMIGADGGILVDVQLAEDGLSFQLHGELLDDRPDHAAGTAPLRPAVQDEDRVLAGRCINGRIRDDHRLVRQLYRGCRRFIHLAFHLLHLLSSNFIQLVHGCNPPIFLWP